VNGTTTTRCSSAKTLSSIFILPAAIFVKQRGALLTQTLPCQQQDRCSPPFYNDRYGIHHLENLIDTNYSPYLMEKAVLCTVSGKELLIDHLRQFVSRGGAVGSDMEIGEHDDRRPCLRLVA